MNNKEMEKEELIHLPDLLLARYCHKWFGVNRGIYNTIDEFFFMEGINEITERRKKILDFLSDIQSTCKTKNNRNIKFGHNGLSASLQAFLKTKGENRTKYQQFSNQSF